MPADRDLLRPRDWRANRARQRGPILRGPPDEISSPPAAVTTCSAGTFTSLKAANKAWQQAEAKVAEGRGGQSHRGRQLFERYVEDVWFPNHVMELTTHQNYTYSLNRHIMPTFAEFRMIDILPADVRE